MLYPSAENLETKEMEANLVYLQYGIQMLVVLSSLWVAYKQYKLVKSKCDMYEQAKSTSTSTTIDSSPICSLGTHVGSI